MEEFKGMIIPFLIAGTTVVAVKFTAAHMNNPALSAVLGGIPIGLLSIYFLTSENSIPYAHNYFYVTLCLLISIMVFYMIRIHTELDKNVVLLIAVVCWAVLVVIHYFIQSKNADEKD